MMSRSVSILRLNHRINRDKRVTTHLFLAARALGANRAYYAGQKDETVERSIRTICDFWGGTFKLEYVASWKKIIRDWKKRDGKVVHLTMYGLPMQELIKELQQSSRTMLIIVGGAKVPGAVYDLANWNVSVTSQPHSEISALSILLYELFKGEEMSESFKNAKKRIIPQAKGKKIENLRSDSADAG